MKQFTFKADIILSASSVDDAFLMLADHFLSLYGEHPDGSLLSFDGSMDISPIEEVGDETNTTKR